jgi:hypothetical protein
MALLASLGDAIRLLQRRRQDEIVEVEAPRPAPQVDAARLREPGEPIQSCEPGRFPFFGQSTEALLGSPSDADFLSGENLIWRGTVDATHRLTSFEIS